MGRNRKIGPHIETIFTSGMFEPLRSSLPNGFISDGVWAKLRNIIDFQFERHIDNETRKKLKNLRYENYR